MPTRHPRRVADALDVAAFNANEFLRAHRLCGLCGKRASSRVEHWPLQRRALVAAGVADPDAWQHLRALCDRCQEQLDGTSPARRVTS